MKRGYLLPNQLTGHELECIQIWVPKNREYKAAFWGAITSLCKWYNWETTGTRDGAIASNYWKEILRYVTWGNCESEPMTPQTKLRIVDCVLQVSYDGELTWQNLDLRNCFLSGISVSDGVLEIDYDGDGIPDYEAPTTPGQTEPDLPAEMTGDQACGAAHAVAKYIYNLLRDSIAALENASDKSDMIYYFVPIFPYVPVDEIIQLVNAVFGAVAASALSELNATDETDLICWLYAQHEGYTTPDVIADWVSLQSWGANIEPFADAIIRAIPPQQIKVQAKIGMQDTTRSCSDCPGYWCYVFDFAQGPQGWTADIPGSEGYGAHDGVSWISVRTGQNQNGPIHRLYIRRSFVLTTVFSISIDFDGGNGIYNRGMNFYPGGQVYQWTSSGDHYQTGIEAGGDSNEVWIYIVDNAEFRIRSITMSGTGINPFGENNCP